MIVFLLVLLLALLLGVWLYALSEIIMSNFSSEGNKKLAWLVALTFIPIGFILYLLLGKNSNINSFKSN
jgi:uncharacterized BrkB/YihY/UPF0761 family membrane protein